MITSDAMADLLERGLSIKPNGDPLEEAIEEEDPFVIVPPPKPDDLRNSRSASVDLRLGTWFVTLRNARVPYLQAGEKIFDAELSGGQLTKSQYVPFGEIFWLHPQNFVLGVTLEWLRLPSNYGGYVTSRSSWGRRGLVIATATGVHPGFTGCLTLELSNVGEIPIPLRPGMALCQLFLHCTGEKHNKPSHVSKFAGTRRPKLGEIKPDDFFTAVSHAYKMDELPILSEPTQDR